MAYPEARESRPAADSFLGFRVASLAGRGHRWPWRAVPPPPDSATFAAKYILRASEGRQLAPIPVYLVEEGTAKTFRRWRYQFRANIRLLSLLNRIRNHGRARVDRLN